MSPRGKERLAKPKIAISRGVFRDKTGMPRRALVLAAGHGRRLRPLSWLRPKAMMPLNGVPMLERALRRLEAWQVTDAVVNTHALAGQVVDALRQRRGNLTVTVSEEPCLLGTGGALRPLQSFFGHAPFWILNADILAELDPWPLLERFNNGSDCLACAWVTDCDGPCTLDIGRDGCIRSFTGGRPGTASSATFCGLQLVSPRIFNYLESTDDLSLVSLYQRAMDAGERIAGCKVDGSRWDDAGTLHRYCCLNLRSASGGRASHQQPCVIWPGGWVAPDARMPACVVTDGARLSGVWPHAVAVDAQQWPDPALAPILKQAGWPVAQTVAAPLSGRGSDRWFLRLGFGRGRAIYVRHGKQWAENRRYAAHARLLAACGVRAPRVLAAQPALRALLLEDLGDRSLQRLLIHSPRRAGFLYDRAMPGIARLHTVVTAHVRAHSLELEPPLDAALFAAEQALMAESLLRMRYGRQVDAAVQAEWDVVSDRLCREPVVVVHRDLQSSNLMYIDGEVAMIDFQGMRMGPAAYDLASMLYDPYLSLSGDVRRCCLDAYRQAVGDAAGDVRAALPWAAVQRLSQALGAYGRLSAKPSTARFAAYIPTAAKRLEQAAGVCGLKALARLAALILTWEADRHHE